MLEVVEGSLMYLWCTCWTCESLRVESCLYRDFGCVWLLSVMKFCECLCAGSL